jgi:hypothetical protein
MCPYFISKERNNFCEGVSSNAFSPSEKRQEEHCRGSFIRCVFYQFKTGWPIGFQESIREK